MTTFLSNPSKAYQKKGNIQSGSNPESIPNQGNKTKSLS